MKPPFRKTPARRNGLVLVIVLVVLVLLTLGGTAHALEGVVQRTADDGGFFGDDGFS